MDLSEQILGIPRKFVDLSEQIHEIVRKILGIPTKFMDLSEHRTLNSVTQQRHRRPIP